VTVHLPLYDKPSSLHADGTRNFVHPADVTGRFDRARKLVFAGLVAWLVLLPWWKIGGHPAVFLDVEQRAFYLFGATFNAQDTWLVFFLLTGLGFSLIVVTALWGRLWCGYACPQTVFLEGVFRPIERLLEGPRNERMRRNRGPLTFDKAWRKLVKHAIFVVLSFLLAHVVVSYFVSLPKLYAMVLTSPSEHPEAFAWASVLTAILYFDFFWFREQLCLIVCPYGRLQSALTDRDTLVIGYDGARGEPRGKTGRKDVGACVDCKRCVVVCPTGIDIRNGLQIDCIGCARCIDACDEVMHKLDRPAGLVRYDSQNGFAGQRRSFLRPRVYLYGALGALGALAFSLALARSEPFEANLLRLRGAPPFSRQDGRIRNAFEVHLVNKRSGTSHFSLQGGRDASLRFIVANPEVTLGSLEHVRVPIFVELDEGRVRDGKIATIEVRQDGAKVRVLHAPLVAPR
jgi:cytochrome c oxidase accessory protein FixG